MVCRSVMCGSVMCGSVVCGCVKCGVSGEYFCITYTLPHLLVCCPVHYSSGVGIHSFPPQGQLLPANLQDQGTRHQREMEGEGNEDAVREGG